MKSEEVLLSSIRGSVREDDVMGVERRRELETGRQVTGGYDVCVRMWSRWNELGLGVSTTLGRLSRSDEGNQAEAARGDVTLSRGPKGSEAIQVVGKVEQNGGGEGRGD